MMLELRQLSAEKEYNNVLLRKLVSGKRKRFGTHRRYPNSSRSLPTKLEEDS